jgi:hypothetical protein
MVQKIINLTYKKRRRVTRAFIKTCLSRPIAWQPVWRQALQELLRVLPRRPVLQQELPSRQEQQAWQQEQQI